MHIRSALLMSAVICGMSLMAGGAIAASDDSTVVAANTTNNGGTATSASSNNSASGGIETVTVTARQYAESIQTAPVSVTALNADLIAKLFVHNLTDIDHQAPNFTIEGVGAIHRNAAVIYSRGIGYSGVDMGQDPAVGVSINGVYEPSNVGMLTNTFDIDGIQILRGPQGTLFGKNTVGGVINITTKLPGDQLEYDAMVRAGNFGRIDFSLGADIPITDTLSARVSVQSQYSNGPFKNAYTGGTNLTLALPPGAPTSVPKYLGGDNIKTVRGTLVWKPSSNFEADLVASYAKDRSPSVGGQNGSIPLSHITSNGAWDYLATFFGHPGYDYRTPGQPYPVGPNPPYTVYRNFPSGDFQDTTNISLNMRYHADSFDVVSVSGYVRDGNLSYSDYDDTELNFFQSIFGLDNRQWSQELRVESNDSDSPLKWVAGALYIGKNWHGQQLFYSSFATLNDYIDYAKQNDESWALFGQADYNITPDLQLTAGIRYTDQRKDITRVNSHLAAGASDCDPSNPYFITHPFNTTPPQNAVPTMACTFHFSKSWSNATYHAGINYKIDEDKMVYASWSTGFVAGGFNSRVDSQFLTGLAYAPETATAWEIGLKSEWYDHHLRVNVAAFLNKYANLQVGAFIPGGGLQSAIVNNAFERAQGVELEVTALPLDHLTLNASVGLLDANYTNFFSNVFGSGAANYASLRPTRTPKWTMNFQGAYDIDLAGNGTLTPSASVQIETSHYTDLTNNPVGFQPAYAMFNASLVYNEPNDRWQVSLWGKNLNNARVRLSAVPSSGYFTQLYFGNPATYGVDLTLKL
jgi:iron complex outermembrane receptor protein